MKFYLKVAIKNSIFYLFILFYIFILYIQHSSLQTSVQYFTIVNLFSVIVSNIYSLVLSSKIVSGDYELVSFYEKNKFDRYIIAIKTMFIISTLTSLLSIITILIFANRNISGLYILKGIINYFILWSISNILSATIGATFSIILNKKIGVVVSLSLYIFFVIEVYDFPMTIIGKLLNIFNDSTSILENILVQEIFNISYILDKLFIILLVILMMIITRIIIINKNRFIYCFKGTITIIIIAITIFMSYKSVSYTKKDIAKLEQVEYEIENYKMNVEIDTILKNSVNIDLKVNSDVNKIKFLLDDIFKINKVKVNNKEANYLYNNGVIEILYDAYKNDNLKIEIDYKGMVHVENNIGVDTYYANISGVNLPGNIFFWYPTLNNDLEINYTVNVSCFSNLFSNLDISNNKDFNLLKNYTLKGLSSEVSLFFGDYKVVKKDDIEYIIPSSYNLDIFIENLNGRINDIISNPSKYNISEDKLKEVKNYNYKKVILSVWENNTTDFSYNNIFRIVNDTLIINYF